VVKVKMAMTAMNAKCIVGEVVGKGAGGIEVEWGSGRKQRTGETRGKFLFISLGCRPFPSLTLWRTLNNGLCEGGIASERLDGRRKPLNTTGGGGFGHLLRFKRGDAMVMVP
jgi:hypothetical protein